MRNGARWYDIRNTQSTAHAKNGRDYGFENHNSSTNQSPGKGTENNEAHVRNTAIEILQKYGD